MLNDKRVDEYALNFEKSIAWETDGRPPEVNVSINDVKTFEFTRRWFRNRNQTTFSTYILPRFPGDKPWKAVQIGVFEGMDLVWQFQHTLSHPESRCLAVDPYLPTPKLDQEFMDGAMDRAKKNLMPFRKKLELIRGKSQDILKEYIENPIELKGRHVPAGSFDYVIIDGDHDAGPVYEDAVLALQLVKVGGWLIFDDVRNNNTFKNHVKHGLERFTAEHGDALELVWFHRYMNAYERTK